MIGKLKWFALTVVAIGVIIMISIIALQTRLIFFPGKLANDYKFELVNGAEEVFISTADGETINGLFYPGTREDVVIYFHGNAGDLSSWQRIAKDLTDFGFSLLLIDYRGYGKSTGAISEDGFYLDAEACYQYVKEQRGFAEHEIILYGRSIGSGVAVDLASKRKVKGLILEAPYASLKQLVKERVPYLFPDLWFRYNFDSISKMTSVRCPVMFIHGNADAVIPIGHGLQLFKVVRERKHFVEIDGGPHNNLNVFPEYFNAITLAATEFFL